MKTQQYVIKWMRIPMRKQTKIASTFSIDTFFLTAGYEILIDRAPGILCRVSVYWESRRCTWLSTLSSVITWGLLELSGGREFTGFGPLCDSGVFLGNWSTCHTSGGLYENCNAAGSWPMAEFLKCGLLQKAKAEIKTWMRTYFERSLGNTNTSKIR